MSTEDIQQDLTAIVSTKLLEPQFEGQTKEYLGNRKVEEITHTVASIGLLNWLNHNPESTEKIVAQCVQIMKGRKK